MAGHQEILQQIEEEEPRVSMEGVGLVVPGSVSHGPSCPSRGNPVGVSAAGGGLVLFYGHPPESPGCLQCGEELWAHHAV